MIDLDAGVARLSLLLGMMLLAPVLVAVLRKSFDPIEPIYLWLSVYGFIYLIKPVARVISGEPFSFGEENLEWAMSVSVIGLIAFYIGYYSRVGHVVASHVPSMLSEVSSRRIRIFALILIAIGAAGLWQYMEISGGWREFWSLPHGYGGKPELTTAYIYQLPELMIVGFFLIVYDAMVERQFTIRSVGRIAFALIGGIGVYTVLWSRRTFILWVLISLFVLFYLIKQRRPGLISTVLFGIAIFVAITLTVAYRPHLHLGATDADFAAVEPRNAAVSSISQTGDEFDSFLAIVSLYPDRIDYDYFQIYARIFIHPIPRIIWPEKPPLFVSSWDEFLFQSKITKGASESVLGDLYIQLGLLGVIIGMLVSGALWKFLFAYVKKVPSSGFMHLLYAVALGNIPSFIVQSGISAFWKWMPFMIPGIVVAYWVAKRRIQIPWFGGAFRQVHMRNG